MPGPVSDSYDPEFGTGADAADVREGIEPYGYELILDMHGCDVATFNRASLDAYFRKLCKAIDMERCEVHFWDDVGVPKSEQQTSPQTKGTSAVQFIITSSIVVHTLDLLEAAYVNIFSCKGFDADLAEELTKAWFNAERCQSRFITRGGFFEGV